MVDFREISMAFILGWVIVAFGLASAIYGIVLLVGWLRAERVVATIEDVHGSAFDGTAATFKYKFKLNGRQRVLHGPWYGLFPLSAYIAPQSRKGKTKVLHLNRTNLRVYPSPIAALSLFLVAVFLWVCGLCVVQVMWP